MTDINHNNDDNEENVLKVDKTSNSDVRLRLQLITECMITQITTIQTLQILGKNGFKITDRTLRRDKNKIKQNNLKRLFEIAKNYDFQNQHIEKLQKLEYLEQGMFDDIRDCKDPFKRAKIREMIANLQPITSSYMDYASYVAEKIPQDITKKYYKNNMI